MAWPIPCPCRSRWWGIPRRRGGARGRRLPTSLAEASEAFATSNPLKEALGDSLHRALLDSQAAEVRFAAALSDEQLVAAYRHWPLVETT